jgi:hypothetical protein
MKKLFLFFCLLGSSIVYSQNSAFDFLNQYHEVHKVSFGLQNYTGISLRDMLLKEGYREDDIGGYYLDLQDGERLRVMCKIINNRIQTTVRCKINNYTEQIELFNSIIDDFTQVLGRRSVSSTGGLSREWRDTPYGNITVMYFNFYVTFSMSDTI